MAESPKYNKAVAKATGAEPTHAPDAIRDQAPMPPGVQGMISSADPDTIAQLMQNNDLEFAPQVLSLEEGQRVDGILEGNGPQAEVMDPVDKTTRLVDTWIIAHPLGTARVSILTSAQLERKLPPFIGSPVTIIRGKDIKATSGRRVADYMVAGPKRADGVRRSWATLPAGSTQAALPETTATPAATGTPTNSTPTAAA